MSFCENCGKELPEGAPFCQYCGAKQEIETTGGEEQKAKKAISKKTILLIVVAVVIVAAAVTVGIIFAKRANDRKKVAEAIKNAQKHFQEMEYDKAIDDLDTAVKIDPENPAASMILARSYDEIGSFEKAKAAYDKAFKYLKEAESEDTSKDTEGSDDQEPSDEELTPYLAAGKFYVSINDFDAAKETVEDGIALISEKIADQTEKLATEELIKKEVEPDQQAVKDQLFTMQKDLESSYYEYYYVYVVNKSVDDTNPYGENTKTSYDYEYDESGRLFRITGHVNGGNTDVMKLGYDEDGHLTAVSSSMKKSRTAYTYDKDGTLTSADIEANGEKSSATYTSEGGNITEIEQGDGAEKTYDYRNGRVSGIKTESKDGETELKIKEESGLIVEISTEGKNSATCEYDAHGNLTKISDQDNILGEGAGTKTYSYKQIRVMRGSWEPNEFSNPTVTGILTNTQHSKIIKQTGRKGYEDRSKDPAVITKELSDAKQAAIKELEIYKNASDYREAQQSELKTAIENGKKSINNAMTRQEVTAALVNAKKPIDVIKTDAQLSQEEEAQRLQEAKSKIAGSYSFAAAAGGLRQTITIQSSGTAILNTSYAMDPEEENDQYRISIQTVQDNGNVVFTATPLSGEWGTYTFTYIAASGNLSSSSGEWMRF